MSISNGLAWSEDNTTFYFVDTCEYKVEAFKCDFDNARISEYGVSGDKWMGLHKTSCVGV